MSQDATVALIHALIEHIEARNEWESLAMNFQFEPGYFSASGYTYTADGSHAPATVRAPQVTHALGDYLESLYPPGSKPPVSVLVQFDRSKGAYEIQIEDDDIDRWHTTAHNIEEMPGRLRPNFDD